MFHVKHSRRRIDGEGRVAPGARFSRQSRRSRGNRSQLGRDAIEVRVHPRDSLVRDLPGQLGGGALFVGSNDPSASARSRRRANRTRSPPGSSTLSMPSFSKRPSPASPRCAGTSCAPARATRQVPARPQPARRHPTARRQGAQASASCRFARRPSSANSITERQPLPGCLFLNVYYTLPHIEEWRRDGTRRLEEEKAAMKRFRERRPSAAPTRATTQRVEALQPPD